LILTILTLGNILNFDNITRQSTFFSRPGGTSRNKGVSGFSSSEVSKQTSLDIINIGVWLVAEIHQLYYYHQDSRIDGSFY
jgi:hypothetical protein